ncbi:class I SAM-dependent methyltransferase [bacterium]|nr:class I SAM-dependent methyltransferase [bacterium]
MGSEQLENFLRKLELKRLLDIGVGDGERLAWILERLPSLENAVAVDVRESALKLAGERLSELPITLKLYDGKGLPFDNASFDAVALFNVLHHVPEGDALLAEAWRMLQPGGRLLLRDCLADTDDQPQHNRLELHRLAHEVRDEPYLNRSLDEVLGLIEQLPKVVIEERWEFVPDHPDGLLDTELLDTLRKEMIESDSKLLQSFDQLLARIETEGIRHQNYIFLSLVKP